MDFERLSGDLKDMRRRNRSLGVAVGLLAGGHVLALVVVLNLLGAVRTEFGKFGDVLAKAQKQLQDASNTLDKARGKTTTISRKLRDVQSVPEPEAARLLSLPQTIEIAPDA